MGIIMSDLCKKSFVGTKTLKFPRVSRSMRVGLLEGRLGRHSRFGGGGRGNLRRANSRRVISGLG